MDDFDSFNNTARGLGCLSALTTLAVIGGVLGTIVYLVSHFAH